MKRLVLFLSITALLVACGPSRQDRIVQIEDFEDSLTESAIVVDSAAAEQLTNLYVEFADKYPSDSLAPQYLMKAADMQSNVMNTERAVALFDRIIENYPDFDQLPICYFLKGNAYESNRQFEEAKAAYQVFVDKFPDHFMAEQTRKMIPLVGMSPEEMLDKILDDANNSIIAQ